jgi:hypothetical protein
LGTRADDGHLTLSGQVEVVSRLERDGRPVFRDLRWGLYVSFAAENDYIRKCLKGYGPHTNT